MNNLPKKIAVFPLSNAIFFPKTQLPLNIFEDRVETLEEIISFNLAGSYQNNTVQYK